MSQVRSPCIDVCSLNEEDVCIGCWRHVEEISNWRELTDVQKREVLVRAQQRALRLPD